MRKFILGLLLVLLPAALGLGEEKPGEPTRERPGVCPKGVQAAGGRVFPRPGPAHGASHAWVRHEQSDDRRNLEKAAQTALRLLVEPQQNENHRRGTEGAEGSEEHRLAEPSRYEGYGRGHEASEGSRESLVAASRRHKKVTAEGLEELKDLKHLALIT